MATQPAERNKERIAVSGRASARRTHIVRKSEAHSPRKLNHARQIVLAGHLAKLGTPALWRIKLRPIEQIEELTPELKCESTIRAKLRVFEGGKVEVLLSVASYVRLGTRIGAIPIVVRSAGREYRSVVPLFDFLVSGTG
jgi:hypothetical protein